jgi:threonine aldolase
MRQAGYLAAAGIFALKNNIERLKEDHTNAKMIADEIAIKAFVKQVFPVETNIIIFELNEKNSAPEMVGRLKEKNILGYAIAPDKVRLVVHLDINPEMVDRTIEVIKQL